MPKERRKRSGGHEPSVKLSNRQFATHVNAVKHIEIGDAIEVPSGDILEQLSHEEPRSTLSKKEKHQLKREALLQRLGSYPLPSSKSHSRRMKRKAKEQIASGFGDIQAAIAALDGAVPQDAQDATQPNMDNTDGPREKATSSVGKIGEGGNATLSKAQRKRALQLEQLRHPLILSNPDFASNPFQTIRTHAQNTLLKH